MIFDERTYSVLAVSASAKFNDLLSSVLPEGIYSPVIYASSVTVAKRALIERNFDLIIVNTPLADEFGTNFAIDTSRTGKSVCMIIVKDEIFEEIYSRVASQGVFTLSKPLNSTILSRSIKWMETVRERIRITESKTVSVEEKMEEIRIVNRAKWLLIDKKQMSEDDAHHFIEKQAMNRSISRRAIADEILAGTLP